MYYQRVRPFRDWPMPSEFQNVHRQDDNEVECSGSWIPKIDVQENSDAIVLHAELPGMKKEDIKLSVRDKVLSISGNKKWTAEKDERMHRSERTFGEFCRRFVLPRDIDVQKTSASFKDGVLELTLPKSERAKEKDITIKSE